jgi:predicted ATPase
LRDREAVVVLDNCEHVLDAAASVTSAVLAAGAGMRIVATSREPLGIAGEAQVPVPTLELAAAARLFADRAAAVRPDFDADAAEVSRVCEQLDGLPLAIELAAARVKALPVEQIAARLQDRFRLLSGGARDAAERHRTLRAAVEWSYDLLFDDEQRAFCALAVFPGTFDLDAAEAVCEAVGLEGADVVDLVAHLVDKSLVITDGGRYRMLETLRRFGLERVADAARHAHASFFLAVAEDALPATFGAGQLASLDRVDREHDNFRAALDFLIAAEPARAVQLAGALAWPWWLRGHRQEARHVLDVALEAAGDDADAIVRCRALRWAGYLVSATGWAGVLRSPEEEQALAHQRCQAAIALAGAAGDRAELAHARRQLAVTLTRDVAYGGIEQLDAIAELLGASIAIFEELGDKWGVGAAHVVLAYAGLATGDVAMATRAVAHARLALAAAGERFALARLAGAEAMLAELGGDVDGAAGHYRDGLAVARELGLGDVVAAFATQLTRLAGDAVTAVDGAEQLSPDHAAAEAAMRNRLGEAAFAEGDLDRAEEQHRQALELYREHGMADGVSASLFRLAEVAEARGSADR